MMTSRVKLKAIGMFIFVEDLHDDNEPMMTKDTVNLIIPLLFNTDGREAIKARVRNLETPGI